MGGVRCRQQHGARGPGDSLSPRVLRTACCQRPAVGTGGSEILGTVGECWEVLVLRQGQAEADGYSLQSFAAGGSWETCSVPARRRLQED